MWTKREDRGWADWGREEERSEEEGPEVEEEGRAARPEPGQGWS